MAARQQGSPASRSAMECRGGRRRLPTWLPAASGTGNRGTLSGSLGWSRCFPLDLPLAWGPVHVGAHRVVAAERERHGPQRTLPVLRDDQVNFPGVGGLLLVHVLAVQQDHDVAVLL